MAVPTLTKAIELAKNFGFFDTVLPFLLIYALVYGILNVSGIFGKKDETKYNVNAINAIISFVIAFLVISTTKVVQVINSIVPSTSVLLVIALMAMLLLGIVGFPTRDYFGDRQSKSAKWLAAILMLIFVGVLFYSFGFNVLEQFNLNPDSIQQVFTQQFFELLIAFGLLIGLPVIVVYIITKSKKPLS